MYISAMSNAAAFHGEEFAYFIWGIKDHTREIVGTNLNYDKDVKNEPIKHYLARLLTPSISFNFEKFDFDGKKVVCLTIPAAKRIITEFNKERYIRIGSSKELFRKYPERESKLFSILTFGEPTILTVESSRQDLSFKQLFGYYGSKGLVLNKILLKLIYL